MLKKLSDDKVINESAEFWYNKSNASLSSDDIKEAHRNLTGFFQVLSEWDERNRAQQ